VEEAVSDCTKTYRGLQTKPPFWPGPMRRPGAILGLSKKFPEDGQRQEESAATTPDISYNK